MQLLFIFAFSFCLSMGEEVNDENSDNEYLNTNISEADREQEWYMIIIFSLVIGFFVTLFAAFIAYFSIKEDSLMRHYKKEGVYVLADVLSAFFVRSRNGGVIGSGKNKTVNSEYAAYVEYDEVIRDGFKVRVRKQVKVLETDFVDENMLPWKDFAEKSQSSSAYYMPATTSPNNKQTHAEASSSAQPGLELRRRCVELYVLPFCPKSGYPVKQVERATGIKHRVWTVALVAFDILLAAFCIHVALDAAEDLNDHDDGNYGFYAIAVFTILFVLEIPMIHCIFGNWFSSFLQEEFMENGDFLIRDDDQSTIASDSITYVSMAQLESFSSSGLGSSMSKLSIPCSFA